MLLIIMAQTYLCNELKLVILHYYYYPTDLKATLKTRHNLSANVYTI